MSTENSTALVSENTHINRTRGWLNGLVSILNSQTLLNKAQVKIHEEPVEENRLTAFKIRIIQQTITDEELTDYLDIESSRDPYNIHTPTEQIAIILNSNINKIKTFYDLLQKTENQSLVKIEKNHSR
jgi:hypothetical protein